MKFRFCELLDAGGHKILVSNNEKDWTDRSCCRVYPWRMGLVEATGLRVGEVRLFAWVASALLSWIGRCLRIPESHATKTMKCLEMMAPSLRLTREGA